MLEDGDASRADKAGYTHHVSVVKKPDGNVETKYEDRKSDGGLKGYPSEAARLAAETGKPVMRSGAKIKIG